LAKTETVALIGRNYLSVVFNSLAEGAATVAFDRRLEFDSMRQAVFAQLSASYPQTILP